MQFRIRFQVSIVTAILLIIAVMTAATLTSVYVASTRTARETAVRLFEQVAQGALARIDRQVGQTLVLANLGAALPGMTGVSGDGLGSSALPFLYSALEQEPSLYSLYYGFADGSFLQVIATRGDQRILDAHQAPADAGWIVRAISGQGEHRHQIWTFLDRERRIVASRIDDTPTYDPRQRPWYLAATDAIAADPQLSAAYVFNSLREPGITASRRLNSAQGVFGVDITLAGLSAFVASQNISAQGGMVLFDESGRVLALSPSLADSQLPLLADMAELRSPLVRALLGAGIDNGGEALRVVETASLRLLAQIARWHGTRERGIGIAILAPADDFVGPIRAMRSHILLLALGELALLVPIALLFSSRMAHSVRALAADAGRVRDMNFTATPPLSSRIIEFDELDKAFDLMKHTLEARKRQLDETRDKLARLVDLGIAMSAERDSNRLMEMVLQGAKELTNADGGTLYIRSDDDKLQFQIVRNDTLGVALGGTTGNDVTIPPVAMFDADGHANHRNVVSHAVHAQQTVVIADAYDATSFDFSGTRIFDERNGYRSKSFLTVPLKPRGGDVIGALQLINARPHDSDEVVPFSPDIQRFVEALAAQAATALYNRDLLSAQERLMDAMIQLIAGAIDAKSPYTGGHCERVPELAQMLAQEATAQNAGPLADFRFDTDEQWREFRIGAWLHDCGKVVTPEYIVDKATKLEIIYNRIHEVRMRFEVLLRDARITQLEAMAAGADPQAAAAEYEARKTALMDDFTFVAECNVGGEYFAPEKVERLKRIAQTTWLRHFDDRLGLAHEELKRYAGYPPEPLPAPEPLLSDKPWHLIPRDGGTNRAYNDLGFQVPVPENLYNRGEVYNLSISRGTLTAEDHFKIKEHIMQTIAMLERLPFPKHLKRVPEYAGTHHETLTGSGYPRALTAANLSVPARIMAIADIFEALTASDRPYKKAKTLSESVKILSFFKKDGHIDADLFDLFLSSGCYRRYAERFLQPDQIDDVDISAYVGAPALQG
ncbi:MAG: HD domain-containing phosphohydrolase [Bacteroidota bacterium]